MQEVFMGLGGEHRGWGVLCWPNAPRVGREDEQIPGSQRRLLLLSLRWKAVTQPGDLYLWPHKLHLPFCPGHSIRHTAPLSLLWFVSRYRKCGKIWSWSQLTSVQFSLCPKGVGTASMTSPSSMCSKIKQNKRRVLHIEEKGAGLGHRFQVVHWCWIQRRPRLQVMN